MIRVLLVDDDRLVRAGLSLILTSDPEISVVGEAGSAEAAVKMVEELAPDLVMMDIRMAGEDGITATGRITSGENPPRVLILTTFHADEYVLGAIEAGASGFLLKDAPPRELIAAVKVAMEGGVVLSPEDTRTLSESFAAHKPVSKRDSARGVLESLTPRELEVAEAVAQGLANAQIARKLGLSEATVKAHLTHVFEKIGSKNRVELALVVRDAELEEV